MSEAESRETDEVQLNKRQLMIERMAHAREAKKKKLEGRAANLSKKPRLTTSESEKQPLENQASAQEHSTTESSESGVTSETGPSSRETSVILNDQKEEIKWTADDAANKQDDLPVADAATDKQDDLTVATELVSNQLTVPDEKKELNAEGDELKPALVEGSSEK